VWEQPIWGWVIINYANYGLQFFLPDGTVYTEVQIGGPAGSPSRSRPPSCRGENKNKQLDQLISSFTDFPKIRTYFTDQLFPNNTDLRQLISETSPVGFGQPLVPTWMDSSAPFDEANKNFRLAATLVDPFTPIHAYTPILPIASLKLPSWTIQNACQKVTAFFHLGPMLMTSDVPTKYRGKFQAKQVIDPSELAKPDPDGRTAKLPISYKALWRWLQPYDKAYILAPPSSFAPIGLVFLPLIPKWC
jgi:hypothetical protein